MLPLVGQTLSTPPFNPAEPRVLSRKGQGWRESFNTRKWRKQYNQFELIVQVWQIYYARKKGADWKEIFRQVSGLMEAEISQHTAYYNGLSQADALVSSYYLVDDIRKEFRAILKIAPAVIMATADGRIWSDRDQVEFIRGAVSEIKQEAILLLRYVPVVAGVDVTSWDGVAEAGVEPVEEKYWASTADRMQHLERMHSDLRTLRFLLDNLHQRVKQTTLYRQAGAIDRATVSPILGIN
ncbi:hypothetical protein [Lewinella sp. IMCC34191]|uniref:hypothetical protein n=1 Tax=Lewinella sp. IMCC34191 TaxID=2259172 RepID=UPI0013009DA1|nr:hypothetical protein [Lewinella sp. IMCC34191]